MLLYHFPLTSNSSTPNLENKGLKSDYVIGGQGQFVSGGKLSSYCWNNQKKMIITHVNGEYSICIRVKSDIKQNPWSALLTCGNSTSYPIHISYSGSTSREVVLGSRTTPIDNLFRRDDGIWHDIIIVGNSLQGSGKLYVDGYFRGVYSGTFTDIAIGGIISRDDDTYNFNCYLQDVRIYDHVLSQQEIKDYSKALVLHYPLNGSELGNVVKDCSGFGYDGKTTNVLRYDDGSPRNKKSVYFGGNVDIDTELSQTCLESVFTISAWVNAEEISNYRGVLGYHGYGGIVFCQCENNRISFAIIKGDGKISGQIFVEKPIGVWSNYTMVYKINAELSLYINGELYQKIEDENLTFTPFSYIHIGRSYQQNIRYWKGNVSDLRIYASALSESDIKALYNQPISLGNSLNAIELSENTKYKSFAWKTPTYEEMNYIINTRANASNLRGLGRVNVNGSYVNGCIILPDNFVAPEGITFTPTTTNYTTNSYTLEQFRKLEDAGVVFLCQTGVRNGATIAYVDLPWYRLGSEFSNDISWVVDLNNKILVRNNAEKNRGYSVRLVRNSSQGKFSTPTGNIDFAPANLQYHCTKHIWRFAEHSYDYIGQANANISDTYDGWIDLFGYGTSGKNFSPTLHSTNNADYASGDISGTDNDWGINEITTNEHEEKNIKLYKSGVITANEISEGDTNEFTANSIQVTKLKED